jgi:hypothetical protein
MYNSDGSAAIYASMFVGLVGLMITALLSRRIKK